MCQVTQYVHPVCRHAVYPRPVPVLCPGAPSWPLVPLMVMPSDAHYDVRCLSPGCPYADKGPAWQCCRCRAVNANTVACLWCTGPLCHACTGLGRAPWAGGRPSNRGPMAIFGHPMVVVTPGGWLSEVCFCPRARFPRSSNERTQPVHERSCGACTWLMSSSSRVMRRPGHQPKKLDPHCKLRGRIRPSSNPGGSGRGRSLRLSRHGHTGSVMSSSPGRSERSMSNISSHVTLSR